MSYHKQCKLIKGNITTVSWIPEEFAHIDKYIKLKDNDEWVDGWKVEFVGTRLPTKYVIDRSQEFKYHRKETDI